MKTPAPADSSCTRGLVDKPVAIDEIKKFLAYRELDNGLHYLPECINDDGNPAACS